MKSNEHVFSCVCPCVFVRGRGALRAVMDGFQSKSNSNKSDTESTHPTNQLRGCNWLLLVLGWLPNLYKNISKTMLFEAFLLECGGGPFRTVVAVFNQKSIHTTQKRHPPTQPTSHVVVTGCCLFWVGPKLVPKQSETPPTKLDAKRPRQEQRKTMDVY